VSEIEVPKGWAVTTLNEICKLSTRKNQRGQTGCPDIFIGLDDIASDTGELINTQQSNTVTSSGNLAKPGQVLYCRLRPYLNKVYLADDEYLCSGELLVLDHEKGIDPRFLLHLMRSPSVVDYAVINSKGDRPRVYWNDLRLVRVLLPPENEQKRLVDELERRLSHIDAALASLQSVSRRIDLAREALLRSIVMPVVGEEVDESGRQILPAGWEWTTLGEVANVVGGVTKDSKLQSDPNFVEVPYLRVANVQRGFLKLDEVTRIRVHPDKAKSLQLEVGDILFNEGGDRDKLGRGWVWEGQVANCIHQNHVFRARLTEPRLHPKFVSWVGNTYGRRWFEHAGKQTTNLASINITVLKSFPIPLPPTGLVDGLVAETERRLSLIDAAEITLNASLLRVAQLRRSLLQTAFSGQLTTRLPGDESADVLLGRLEWARIALTATATAEKRASAPRTRKAKAKEPMT
jgi:type I restriction enzyme S subunit